MTSPTWSCGWSIYYRPKTFLVRSAKLVMCKRLSSLKFQVHSTSRSCEIRKHLKPKFTDLESLVKFRKRVICAIVPREDWCTALKFYFDVRVLTLRKCRSRKKRRVHIRGLNPFITSDSLENGKLRKEYIYFWYFHFITRGAFSDPFYSEIDCGYYLFVFLEI